MSRTAFGTSTKARVKPEALPSVEKLYGDRRFNNKTGASEGRAVCWRCHAIGSAKHWYADPREAPSLNDDKFVHQTLCPGCLRIKERLYEGQVVLDSPLLFEKNEEICALIKHTEGKAWHDNPASRIAYTAASENKLELLTTTRWLATRIGKNIHKAFKGKLEIKPCFREKFVRVYWTHP